MTEIKVTFDGEEVSADIETGTGCLRLHLPEHILEVDRLLVRVALLEAASYNADRDMWWDGYAEALADIERKFARDEAVTLWLAEVRNKFGMGDPGAKHD